MTKTKIYIIGTVGLPSNYGGFETLVENLVSKRVQTCFEYTVFCSKNAYDNYPDNYLGTKLIYVPLNANGIQSIIYDIWSMIKTIGKCDILLVLGVSGCMFLPIYRLFTKSTIITNIDGLEHKRDKWNSMTKKFLKISEWFAVKYSNKIIADNEGIARYIRDEYAVEPSVIAYGGDHVYSAEMKEDIRHQYQLPVMYAFKVCRIEPENNVEMILNAFISVEFLPLVFVGNWESSEFGKSMRLKYGMHKSIKMLDPIYDQSILNQLRSNCTVYIHGHSAGGTNPSLVEAMSLGLPIISYDVIYNRETTDGKALYFENTESLVDIIKGLNSIKMAELRKVMFDIAQKEYSWKKIVSQYEMLYI